MSHYSFKFFNIDGGPDCFSGPWDIIDVLERDNGINEYRCHWGDNNEYVMVFNAIGLDGEYHLMTNNGLEPGLHDIKNNKIFFIENGHTKKIEELHLCDEEKLYLSLKYEYMAGYGYHVYRG